MSYRGRKIQGPFVYEHKYQMLLISSDQSSVFFLKDLAHKRRRSGTKNACGTGCKIIPSTSARAFFSFSTKLPFHRQRYFPKLSSSVCISSTLSSLSSKSRRRQCLPLLRLGACPCLDVTRRTGLSIPAARSFPSNPPRCCTLCTHAR